MSPKKNLLLANTENYFSNLPLPLQEPPLVLCRESHLAERRLLLSTEFDHHLSTLSLPLDVTSSHPFLTDYVCNLPESLNPNEPHWNEKPMKSRREQDTIPEDTESGITSGKISSMSSRTRTNLSPIQRIEEYIDFYRLLGATSEVASPSLLLPTPSPQNPHPNLSLNLPQPQFVPLRNLFGIDSELRDEKTFAELIRTPVLLSPLIKLPTFEEDISCVPATISLLDTIAELRSLFPILPKLPSSTTSPTSSSLLTAEFPVSPYQDLTHPETPIRVIDNSFVRSLWSLPGAVEGPPTKKIRVRARGARKANTTQKKDRSTRRH